MQPPLTECARKTLDEAQIEARHLNQEFVGTEHLLLALLDEQGSAFISALRQAGADVEALVKALAEKPKDEET